MGCVLSYFKSPHNLPTSDYHIIKNDSINTFTNKLLIKENNNLLHSIDKNNMTCLMYVCKYNLHLFEYVLKNTPKKIMLMIDNAGKSFLHYLMNNSCTSINDIQLLFKNKK